MGCGISTLDAEDESINQHLKARRHAMVPPVIDKKKEFEKGDELETKEELGISDKEEHSGDDKYCSNNVELEHEDGDYSLIGPGSPSFREYCTDYDCGDRSSMGDSNDCDSMTMESVKNGSDDDSLIGKKKPKNEEHEKKERSGRGFRNAKSRVKTRGRKNLLNFACYNASNESCAEGSCNKINAKTT
ncbi:hypothetical protein CR513_62723, partial [Mucuna pruriens]